MKKILFFVVLFTMSNFSMFAQEVQEPEFVGEPYLLQEQTPILIERDYARFKSGVSWTHNSWNALSLCIDGKHASTRTKAGKLTFVVKATDNNSDPMSIITIFKLKSKSNKRSIVLSADNSDQLFHSSKTYTKNLMKFTGKKYGESSYLITTNLEKGEYAILVKNPNNTDEKSVVVSCFGLD